MRRDGLFRAPVDGGRPALIVRTSSNAGSCVLDDGSIVYSTGVDSPLWRIPAGGGAPVAVTDLAAIPGTYAHVWPQPIPGTNKLLLTCWGNNNIGGARISDTETGAVREIMKNRDTQLRAPRPVGRVGAPDPGGMGHADRRPVRPGDRRQLRSIRAQPGAHLRRSPRQRDTVRVRCVRRRHARVRARRTRQLHVSSGSTPMERSRPCWNRTTHSDFFLEATSRSRPTAPRH
jgi:hypothetical protein